MPSKRISRREALKGLGFAVAGAALAACQPKTVVVKEEVEKVVTQVVKETVIVAGTPKVVEKVVTATPVPGEVPEVWVWPSISLTRAEGSDPVKLAEVQQNIIDAIGVKPMAIVPPGGSANREKINLLLGSRSEELDIWSDNWYTYKDAVIPIDDLLSQYGPDVKAFHIPENWAMMKDLTGRTWGIPRGGLSAHTNNTWIRTNWLEELGLEMPKTLEEMEKAFEAFRERDPDSIIATEGLGNFQFCTVGGFAEAGYANWIDSDDGMLKPPELQPGFKDWVAKVAEWYDKGWLFKESFTSYEEMELIKAGKVGIWAGWYSRMTLHLPRNFPNRPDLEYDFMPKLEGPKGLMQTVQTRKSNATMITKKSKHPEACMRFINWQYADPDNYQTAAHGIKGVDWEWVDESEKYWVRRLVKEGDGKPLYAGEFVCAGGPIETTYSPDDPVFKRHNPYIRDYRFATDMGKMPVDYDVGYDMDIIKEKVPGLADLDRLMQEEVVKFATGVRPVAQWADFIDQLNQAGLQNWIEAYTQQYRAFKG